EALGVIARFLTYWLKIRLPKLKVEIYIHCDTSETLYPAKILRVKKYLYNGLKEVFFE
ncbi:MAG: hypothetical protein ACI9K1_002562, partial [Arcticibacterium sp.]